MDQEERANLQRLRRRAEKHCCHISSAVIKGFYILVNDETYTCINDSPMTLGELEDTLDELDAYDDCEDYDDSEDD